MDEKKNRKKEEITWNNSPIVMLCSFEIWFNSQLLALIYLI